MTARKCPECDRPVTETIRGKIAGHRNATRTGGCPRSFDLFDLTLEAAP